ADADTFVAEQVQLGTMMRADDLPATANRLHHWVAGHPDLVRTDALRDAVGFLTDPPLPTLTRFGYGRLFAAAVATIPPRLRTITGVGVSPIRVRTGVALVGLLRWSLGPSPSWWAALERVGAPVPTDVEFLRPPPIDGFVDAVGRIGRE
ncbi:MAG: DUF2236 domain-containing protein, partial [Acidimicrobiia bacterium]|nr:DUF2236 domain-containing protein [Acidimicrobiia bacterium]